MKQTEQTAVMLFYESFEEAINGLMEAGDTSTALALYRAIVRYGLYGEIPDLAGTALIMWRLIFPNLKNGRNKALAGKKGGKATKHNNPNGRRGKNREETDSDTPGAIPTPPTLEKLKDCIKGMGLNVDAEKFYNYYKSHNWQCNGQPIREYLPLLKKWSERATAATWEGHSNIFNNL